jgi:hypothetical protein
MKYLVEEYRISDFKFLIFNSGFLSFFLPVNYLKQQKIALIIGCVLRNFKLRNVFTLQHLPFVAAPVEAGHRNQRAFA